MSDWQMGQKRKVLDHGHVKLVEWMGCDERVVEAARQSTRKGFISWDPYELCKQPNCNAWFRLSDGQMMYEGDDCCGHAQREKFPSGDMGLMDNLMRNRHTTPFEMGGEIIFEVKAPIMVFREWHRHRTQSYNEMSARYVQMPNEHYLPDPGRVQKQSKFNKQGSGEAVDQDIAMSIITEMGNQQQQVYDSYDAWVEEGLAKEVARLNTPVSRYSQMWAKTDILNWIKFLTLRMRPAAQFEIRQYANIVGEVIESRWPRTWWLFEEYDLFAVRFSRTEMEAIRSFCDDLIIQVGVSREAVLGNFGVAAEKVGLTGTKLNDFLVKLTKGGKEMLSNP